MSTVTHFTIAVQTTDTHDNSPQPPASVRKDTSQARQTDPRIVEIVMLTKTIELELNNNFLALMLFCFLNKNAN